MPPLQFTAPSTVQCAKNCNAHCTVCNTVHCTVNDIVAAMYTFLYTYLRMAGGNYFSKNGKLSSLPHVHCNDPPRRHRSPLPGAHLVSGQALDPGRGQKYDNCQ